MHPEESPFLPRRVILWMMNLPERASQFLEKCETRYGILPAALLASCITLGAACLYVWPKTQPAYHGLDYSALSTHIFNLDFPSDQRFRVLSPLLGWLTGLTGDLFKIIPWIFQVLFLAAVYYEFRRKAHGISLSLLATAIMGFSCTTFIPLISPGYVDPATYCFAFLAFSRMDRPIHSALFWGLALLNHESVLFLFPGLILAFRMRTPLLKNTLRYGIWILLASAPYFLYRIGVGQYSRVHFSTEFYFSRDNIQDCLRVTLPLAPLAAFLAFRLFWFFPAYAFIRSWKNSRTSQSAFFLISFLCIAAQLVIAYDSTRLFCLAFPLVLMGMEVLAQEMGQKAIARKGWILFGFNLLILPAFTGRDQVFPLHSVFYRILEKIIHLPG